MKGGISARRPSHNKIFLTKETMPEHELRENNIRADLRLALKYPLPCKPQLPEGTEFEAEAENQPKSQPESQPSQKRRKTMPFAQLLTNEESLQQLREAEEQTARKAEEIKQRKEKAAKKRVERDQERAKKQEREERIRKKEELRSKAT